MNVVRELPAGVVTCRTSAPNPIEALLVSERTSSKDTYDEHHFSCALTRATLVTDDWTIPLGIVAWIECITFNDYIDLIIYSPTQNVCRSNGFLAA